MFYEILGVSVGIALTALGLDMFLIPNKIAAGGVSGIATILHYLVGVPVGAAMLVLNVPLFLMAIYRLGLKFGFRSLYGTLAVSLSIDALAPFVPVPTGDLLLACLFGGVLVGLGLGIVFRYRGTTGGTDLAAAVLRSYTGANVGQLLFLVDATIVLAAGFAFNSAELAMYALIALVVSIRVIDMVQQGLRRAKAAFIISANPGAIAAAVMEQLQRGATLLDGHGAWSGKKREVLLVVMNSNEVSKLKALVADQDPQAFVIVTEIHEVLGEGFSR